jgi:hypothetical protein
VTGRGIGVSQLSKRNADAFCLHAQAPGDQVNALPISVQAFDPAPVDRSAGVSSARLYVRLLEDVPDRRFANTEPRADLPESQTRSRALIQPNYVRVFIRRDLQSRFFS